MPNNRLYYGITQAGLASMGSLAYTAIHGLQSIGMTTTFNLEQVFEIGQNEIYANIEEVPEISITLEKALDGYPMLWHLATQGSTGNTLAARSNARTSLAVSYFGDTQVSASGTPISAVECSGLYLNSHSLTLPVDGNCTESITLVGNNKVWDTSNPFMFSGVFLTNADVPQSGIQRRQHVVFDYLGGDTSLDTNGQVRTTGGTVLPPDIPGISSSGTNNRTAGVLGCVLQNINVSVNLNRQTIKQLGTKAIYFRSVQFPVEVTCEIGVHSLQGDNVSATEAGTLGNGNNLNNRSIRINTADGTYLDLGTKMKLSSVSLTGGDTSGANVISTYNYQGFNNYTLTQPQQP